MDRMTKISSPVSLLLGVLLSILPLPIPLWPSLPGITRPIVVANTVARANGALSLFRLANFPITLERGIAAGNQEILHINNLAFCRPLANIR